jgi:serine/threonine protein kinase/Tol biopolymer transport system component
MTLATGTQLGRYEIRSLLGKGGMGEVYRAHDPRLGRDVAIKVLPGDYSADPERLRRFEQEARAASALNHPNILAVYDVAAHDGLSFVVAELLEGDTLRERLGRGAMPSHKAIDYAVQIARGLAAAHERGIVHRDLKPENLFLTRDGHVKILDFGLAKLTPLLGAPVETHASTLSAHSRPGAVMGTAGYMSPEQVRGVPVDQRSDIFSFGAVLYEMLSGKREFRGGTAVETLNAILNEDPPDLSETNKPVAPALERVVRRCLEKSPEERFHSASDLAFALEALSASATRTGEQTVAPPAPSRLTRREAIAWGLAAVAVVAALSLATLYPRRAPADERVLKLSVLLPEKATMPGTVTASAISPDGRRLAFVVVSEGRNLLWVRSLDSLDARALPGTDGVSTASPPFWSPDSRFLGFFAGGKLKKVEASGAPPQTLCDVAGAPRGGTWNREGVIVLGSVAGPLYRVAAAGGDPVPVTALDQSRFEATHRWPVFLPDGRHFLYYVRSNRAEDGGIYVGSLDSNDVKRLLPTSLNAAYAPPGFLLFVQNGALMAQRFDADERQLSGQPVPVAEDVANNLALGRGAFSVSENGVLAYSAGGDLANLLLWFDREGKQVGSLGEAGLYFTLALSPDERRAAVDRADPQTGTNDIWLFDLSRGVPSRFTTDPSGDSNPLWSPDGSRIVFASGRDGALNLYQKSASGAASEELLLASSEPKVPNDWSSDGQFILYQTFNTKTRFDLWVLPMSGDRQALPFLQTEFNEQQAQFGPDGKWVAYTSDESGTPEVYVRTYPASGGRWRVSTAGGHQPRWRGDGRELFYIASDRKLMAVDVKLGATFEAGTPRALFETRVLTFTDFRNHYTVAADGQRFLVNSMSEEEGVTPITVVVNWTADLER